jgi:hypothetical protein
LATAYTKKPVHNLELNSEPFFIQDDRVHRRRIEELIKESDYGNWITQINSLTTDGTM